MASLTAALLAPPRELLWALYVIAIWALLPLVARSRRVGSIPRPPCLLGVTHVGGFDVLFVVRTVRRWRMRAIFNRDGRPLWLGLLFQSVWRFPVSQEEKKKAALNLRTEARVVRYLRSGGTAMVFPEGHRYWERRLYPGVARIAYRAGVPIVPVGVSNAYVYRAGTEGDPVGRTLVRLVRETRRRKEVEVHLGPPIYPESSQPEIEEVDRMMRALERWFGEFYRKNYGMEGPTWTPQPSHGDRAIPPESSPVPPPLTWSAPGGGSVLQGRESRGNR